MTGPARPNLKERTFGQWWFNDEEHVEVSVSAVRAAGEEILRNIGASDDEAEYLFAIYLDKALQGDHARGLLDFPFKVRQVAEQKLPLHPRLKILRESASTALVDCETPPLSIWHNTLFHRQAMDVAIDKARSTGIGCVSLRTSLLVLRAQMFQAIDAGMIGMAMTQTYPLVAPLGGFRPMLGNAPIAFGIPAGRHAPVIVDMSCTQSSSSGVHIAARHGLAVPPGLILDEKGMPTTDASTYAAPGHETHEKQRARGTLAVLGNSHKGYALVFAVGLLTAVLTDTNFPWEAEKISIGAPQDGKRFGSILVAIDPAMFGELDIIRSRVDEFIDALKASGTREDAAEILYPGEKSQRLQQQRRQADVFELPKSHYENFCALAAEHGIKVTSCR